VVGGSRLEGAIALDRARRAHFKTCPMASIFALLSEIQYSTVEPVWWFGGVVFQLFYLLYKLLALSVVLQCMAWRSCNGSP
jgi:hypothetical protein